MNIIQALSGGGLQAQANDTATQAANAALDNVAARPFNVVISVDDTTKAWLTVLLILGLVGGALLKR